MDKDQQSQAMAHLRARFVDVAMRILTLRPWTHVLKQDVLVLECDGYTLSHPICSLIGSANQEPGLAFFRSIDQFEAFIEGFEGTNTLSSAEMEELDDMALVFQSELDLHPSYVTGMRALGWSAPGLCPTMGFLRPLRIAEPSNLESVRALVAHLEVAVVCLEGLGDAGFAPYPQWVGEFAFDAEHLARVRPHERAVAAYEEALRSLQASKADVRRKPKIVRLYFEIEGIKPAIWRQIEVPEELTLAGLHEVIQRIMGWQDSELWQFDRPGKVYVLPGQEEDSGFPSFDARVTTLGEALGPRAKSIEYGYDFEANWSLLLRVEERFVASAAGLYPRLVAGGRAAPPDGCGGPKRYLRLLDELRTNAQSSELLDWFGEGFDPEHFVVSAIELPDTLVLNRLLLDSEISFRDVNDPEPTRDPGDRAFEVLSERLREPAFAKRLLLADEQHLVLLAAELSVTGMLALPLPEIVSMLEKVREIVAVR
ncbi:MAG: plasmid pRiA4b ORF-3 family protein [Bradymonadaceae bacterium]|nr:plasmid pRiA4b ORF-3 family protein [Lujinxingiaceae bacterium]